MKRWMCAAVLCLLSSAASAQLECDDLADLSNGLDELAEMLAQIDEIPQDGELDAVLRDLTEVMIEVAEVEDDPQLHRAIETMRQGWNNLDFEAFEAGMDRGSQQIADLWYADCE